MSPTSRKHLGRFLAIALTAFIAISCGSLNNASASGRLLASPINTVLNGTGAPSSTLGTNGDFYIDKKSFNIFGPKTNGRWPLPVSLRGPSGLTGPTGLTGKVTTASGNIITGERGATGPKGETGTAGSNGSAGPIGPIGLTGAPGATGAPGSSGAGSPGPAGAAGATGAQGPIGLTGAAGASSVSVIDLVGAGGGAWTISSSTPAKSASAGFGALAANKSYEFTIYLTDILGAVLDGGATSGVEVTGDPSDSIHFNAQYSYAKMASSTFTNSYTISQVITGTVVTSFTPATNLVVKFIDGTGWSSFNANTLSGRAYLSEIGSVS
jgi:hypothetical protein